MTSSEALLVVELRQYTVHADQRETLIEVFDREFVETQEAEGMRILGQFRDLDRPDRYVWVRGYTDMLARRRGLEAFYTSPTWKAHGKTAAATMVDIDDVLLLRPLSPATGFSELPERPAHGQAAPGATIVVTVCSAAGPVPAESLADTLPRALAATGSEPLAILVTEPSANDYPALPVREGEHVVVWFQREPTPEQLEAGAAVAAELVPGLAQSPLRIRLEPTSRSQLR